MLRTSIGVVAVLLATGGAHAASQQTMRGGVALIKTGKLLRIVASPVAGNLAMTSAGDPTAAGATLRVWDSAGRGGSDTYELPADGWRRMPKNPNKPLKGYRYAGDGDARSPCTAVVVKDDVVKATCRGGGVTLTPPFAGSVKVSLTVGEDDRTFCCSFGGTEVKNDARILKRKVAAAPAQCEEDTTTTTLGESTTSTTLEGETTSTTLIGETTTTTVIGETTSTTCETSTTTTSTMLCDETTTTSIPGGETTSTTVVGETTTTTLLGETTTTSVPGGETTTTTIGGGGCCNGAAAVRFATIDMPGDCGDIIDQGGNAMDLACAGLYTGGGGNSVPLPLTVPDLGLAISAITACEGQTATLGGATSAETGSERNCTATGCLFGAPLAVPNPGTPPTSVCVINRASADLEGTATCDTGATNVDLPLSSVLYLTGDTATDPMATITGVQPCPLCSGGTCIGGPNDGMGCEPGTTDLGGDPAYPTSHDCPPAETFNIGTLPVAFALSTGTVSWTGTPAANDTGSTSSVQSRVFSGFCRDVDGSGAFAGTDPASAQHCWENGMAVGAACSGEFESCEQRNNGAFGPAGGANRTITAIGSASSILGGPAAGTLVSVFSIRPTFNDTVDAAGDLPGPGAVALPGTATLCPTPSTCP
jgi:hypothetical protein